MLRQIVSYLEPGCLRGDMPVGLRSNARIVVESPKREIEYRWILIRKGD